MILGAIWAPWLCLLHENNQAVFAAFGLSSLGGLQFQLHFWDRNLIKPCARRVCVCSFCPLALECCRHLNPPICVFPLLNILPFMYQAPWGDIHGKFAGRPPGSRVFARKSPRLVRVDEVPRPCLDCQIPEQEQKNTGRKGKEKAGKNE